MSFFDELKRRNVIKVTVAYVVVGWLASQVAEFATENFGAPDWVLKVFVVFLLLGLPFVVIFAWAFEMTPDGIKKEKDVDRSQSITPKTGRKLDFTIIGLLVLVAGYFIYESRFAENEQASKLGPDTFSEAVNEADGSLVEKKMYPAQLNDNSIAVLPFANRSKLEDDEFFTDGIHDDLLTQLAKIHDLKVISRTSMMKYKDTELSIPDIARELGVSTILEGGVQRAGKRIRINAQLIDVSNDQHLWAETFDREMTMENIFDIQSEITRQIVTAVRGELSEVETLALNDLPTTNVQAYEAYLKGRTSTFGNYAKENYINAQPWAELAVELDPQFSQAWSLLATIHGMAIWIGYDAGPERLASMREAVDMATLLAPDKPSSLIAQAEYLYRIERDYTGSLAALQKAHEAIPGNADILERMALSQRRLGLWEESVSSNLQTLVLDPGNVSSARLATESLLNMQDWDRVISLGTRWSNQFQSTDIRVYVAEAYAKSKGDLGTSRRLLDNINPFASEAYANFSTILPLLERDYETAIAVWDQPEVTAMTELGGWVGWRELFSGFAWSKLGETEKSRETLEQAVSLLTDFVKTEGTNHGINLGALALAYALLGEQEKALETSNLSKETMPESLDIFDGTNISGMHAQILARTGHTEEALSEIERLLGKPSGLNPWYLHLDPFWDFFRDDPRFVALATPENLNEMKQ
jgi:TolB-like protein/tetratricopeptide (TPR) repeat protein